MTRVRQSHPSVPSMMGRQPLLVSGRRSWTLPLLLLLLLLHVSSLTPRTGERRFRATIAYDGSGFSGVQKNRGADGSELRTVLSTLEASLLPLLEDLKNDDELDDEGAPHQLRRRRGPTFAVAGRTDAGVSATGQVIAFNAAIPLGEDEDSSDDEDESSSSTPAGAAGLQEALNARLPSDLRIVELRVVPPSFDVGRSKWKRYRYRLPSPPRALPSMSMPSMSSSRHMGATVVGGNGDGALDVEEEEEEEEEEEDDADGASILRMVASHAARAERYRRQEAAGAAGAAEEEIPEDESRETRGGGGNGGGGEGTRSKRRRGKGEEELAAALPGLRHGLDLKAMRAATRLIEGRHDVSCVDSSS